MCGIRRTRPQHITLPTPLIRLGCAEMIVRVWIYEWRDVFVPFPVSQIRLFKRLSTRPPGEVYKGGRTGGYAGLVVGV